MSVQPASFSSSEWRGANKKVEVAALIEKLRAGLTSIDPEMKSALGNMVPVGEYNANLLRLRPKIVDLGSSNDYFVSAQQLVWGLDGFWGLPHYPKVPYYRSGDIKISKEERLFEFVIPMYPRNWLDTTGVEQYRAALIDGHKPTAITLSVLDVKSPADAEIDEHIHWCLAHYLLDGHHKTEAAALLGKELSVVSLLAIDKGVSDDRQLERLNQFLDFL